MTDPMHYREGGAWEGNDREKVMMLLRAIGGARRRYGGTDVKVYVTKYALTSGIETYDEAEIIIGIGERKMIKVGKNQYYHKPFWHTTRKAAVEHANKIRLRKIASLQKSIAKLQKPFE